LIEIQTIKYNEQSDAKLRIENRRSQIILKVMKENCSHIASFKQKKTPKLSDLEVAALGLTAEYMMYNSDLQLFRVIKGTVLEDKIERSVFNRRRRKLFEYTGKIRQCTSQKLASLNVVSVI
jgi:hypothetical protein